MTVTATTVTRRRLFTRARGFGLVYLILAALLIFAALTRVDPTITSKMVSAGHHF